MLIQKVGRQLKDKKIAYAIVGGYAVALHGAVRGTMDLDLIVKQSQRAYEDIEEALLELGFESKLPVTGRDVFNFRDEYITNRNMIAWSFYNPKNPSEIVDIIITQDLANLKTVTKKLGNLDLPVLAIDDLIAMKSQTNREQDKQDVKALEQIK